MVDLRELARTEKVSRVLLSLPETFYQDAKTDIQQTIKSLESDNLSEVEKEMLEFALFSNKRDLESINNQRITKLIKAAVSDAYREKPAHSLDSMLPSEKRFYETIVQGIKELRIW